MGLSLQNQLNMGRKIEMSNQPLLTIHVHTLDSHVTRFRQNDPGEVQHILEQIHPDRLFQHNLVLQDKKSTTVFPHAALVRIDLVMEEYPDWPFHTNIVQAMELTEEEFDKAYHQATVSGVRPTQPKPSEVVTTLADMRLANGDQIFARYKFHPRSSTPMDREIMFQHLSTEPIQYLFRQEGGVILINSAHITRLSIYPGLSEIPSAWQVALLSGPTDLTTEGCSPFWLSPHSESETPPALSHSRS